MRKYIQSLEHFSILKFAVRWFILVLPLAFSVGSMVALFLYLLDLASNARWANTWLLYLLPFAGLAIVGLYQWKGKNAEAGNNLILDEIQLSDKGIPLRMSSFILLTTVLTHLCGGSAGREGTAVQIGGSLANYIAKILKINDNDRRILLMCGISAGFAAVFGTPLAGTIFALEVLVIGKIKYDALLPCFFAALIADMVCTAYGIEHTHYAIHFQASVNELSPYFHVDTLLLFKVIFAGVVFGLVSFFFSEFTNSVKIFSARYLKNKYLIVVIGGLILIGLSTIGSNANYLGLGVKTASGQGASIVNAFHAGDVDGFSWLWKLIFTGITLSMGFKGGEVTPLFFIGATLGNSLALLVGAPVDLFAAMGFIAVFAGATNTPLACTFMGVELFGGSNVLYFALACFIAYFFSGHAGIYSSQKLGVSKDDSLLVKNNASLKRIRANRFRKGEW